MLQQARAALSGDDVFRRIVIVLLLAALTGCGSSGRAPLEDRYGTGQSAVSVYNVQRGDTLYSIAFRYGLDYRKVAEVNNITDPYTIYPGQNIYLWNVTPSPGIVAPAYEPTAPVAPARSTVPEVAGTAGSSAVIVTAVPGIAAAPVSQVSMTPTPVYQQSPQPTPGVYHPGTSTNPAAVAATAPSGATATVPAPATEAAPVSTATPAATPVQADTADTAAATVAMAPATVPAPASAPTPATAPAPARAAPPAKPPTPGARVTAWRWPAQGPVSRGYSSSVHKGIDIAGNRGDPVYAVADGTVVYAGTGIVGFGELVIVKHNDIYISAYGHNDRLLVRENDVVGAGQVIAEKGSSGTDTVKLHFEIRKEGKPVDPLKLLPAR
ncbi:MAG: peptidoglycan DD-metalloendopeptidase family protein [Halieaceae bacterium]|nr:peptidoglycan DD-metalloendopeptidase family protein [Halieaceae bacterium]